VYIYPYICVDKYIYLREELRDMWKWKTVWKTLFIFLY